jgi:hypothetical protein
MVQSASILGTVTSTPVRDEAETRQKFICILFSMVAQVPSLQASRYNSAQSVCVEAIQQLCMNT